MNPISFFVPGKAATAGSKRAFVLRRKDGSLVKRSDGSPIVNVTEDNKRSKDWKGDVKRFAADFCTGLDLIDGPIELTLTFHIARPQSHFRTGKNSALLKTDAPKYPASKPDALKLARAVEDALTGVLWVDDAQIVTETLKKRYVGGALGQPGVWVEIQKL